jgi:DNA modification methylase
LPSWFIKLFTQPSDVVLDPFLGSGTTSVACANLDRICIGIEKQSEYIEIAKDRLQATSPLNLFTTVRENQYLYEIVSVQREK